MTDQEKAIEKEVRLRIDRMRWYLMQELPFYGTLASNLSDDIDFRKTWRGKKPTACTNGRRILWSAAFVQELDDEELRFVGAHEVMHVAHQHLWRLPLTALGNKAGDYAINRTLSQVDGLKMPKCGLLDVRFDGLAEEEILQILKNEQGQEGEGGEKGGESGDGGDGGEGDGDGDDGEGGPTGEGDDEGGCGGFEEPDEKGDDGSGGDSADDGDDDGAKKPKDPLKDDSLKDKWEQRVQAAQILSSCTDIGNMPADLEIHLKRVKATDIDWKRETAEFAKEIVSGKNDWSRSARRHATQPVIYPRKRTSEIGEIAWFRDASGSCASDETLLAEHAACIDAAMAETGCSSRVFDFDTIIQREYLLDVGEECPKIVKGGGGTSFLPGIARLRQLIDDEGVKVAGAIYLTDGMGDEPKPADIPDGLSLLWIIYGPYRTEPMKTGRTIWVKRAM